MNATTPIASLVESMLSDGVEHGAIIRAVEAAVANLDRGAVSVRNGRGTRLPTDWRPSKDCLSYAAKRGLAAASVEIEAEKFKNFWTAKTGASATKRDWGATWRNWIINAMEDHHASRAKKLGPSGAHSIARRAPTGADAVLAGMGRLAHRLSESRNAARQPDRQIPRDPDASREPDADG
jgi:hypothetical protein